MRYYQMDIPKRGLVCKGKGESFAPGMEYYSVLQEDPALGLQRHDYCLHCWQNDPRNKEVVEGQVSWRASVALSKEAFVAPSQRDHQIQQLFHSLSAIDHPAERFILALYLQRRKRLFLRSELVDESGQIILLYEIPETEEMLSIQKVALTHIPLQQIQVNIAQKLKAKNCA
jgi:hypothetical protein